MKYSIANPSSFAQISCFCVTVFLGAFLLFQIEPVIGKIVTPLYGGTASVWIVCLLFFQLVVLTGYILTFTITKLTVRVQLYLYLVLLVFSLFCSYLPEPSGWQAANPYHPILSLLTTLSIRLAIPCILLSTISGVMQVWFGLAKLGDPYPLYSVSNLGSIGALLTYPILIEPNLAVTQTTIFWFWSYLALVLCVVTCATIVRQRIKNSPETILQDTVNPSLSVSVDPKQFLQWIFFSVMGSVILLSYSNYITNDISPTPLLWVLPLSIYLLTFVLVFSKAPFYQRTFFLKTWLLFFAIETLFTQWLPIISLILNLLIIFELCMICHGELANSKPAIAKLPTFYLAIAIGGVLGGVFIAIIAPLVFSFPLERLLVVAIMAFFTIYQLAIKKLRASNYILVALLLVLSFAFWLRLKSLSIIYSERNFYGSAQVAQQEDCLALLHGRINHGQQYLDPSKATQPAGHYYGLPLQFTIDFLRDYRSGSPLSIGGIGLGVGTLAAYGQTGDTITFYELDPKIKKIALKFFTYLANSKATIKINIGDGRATLKSLPPQNYDLLLVDAFNGDAIPAHMLTSQAITIYLSHLKPDGLLLFHTTNIYVDVAPVLGNLSKKLNLHAYNIVFPGQATYVMLCRDTNQANKFLDFSQNHKDKYSALEISSATVRSKVGIWTDDFNNLLGIFRF